MRRICNDILIGNHYPICILIYHRFIWHPEVNIYIGTNTIYFSRRRTLPHIILWLILTRCTILRNPFRPGLILKYPICQYTIPPIQARINSNFISSPRYLRTKCICQFSNCWTAKIQNRILFHVKINGVCRLVSFQHFLNIFSLFLYCRNRCCCRIYVYPIRNSQSFTFFYIVLPFTIFIAWTITAADNNEINIRSVFYRIPVNSSLIFTYIHSFFLCTRDWFSKTVNKLSIDLFPCICNSPCITCRIIFLWY